MFRPFRGAILVGAISLAASGCYQAGETPSKPLAPRPAGEVKDGIRVGDRAIEIEGMDADEKHFKLSDYRGKVVLLDFWAGW